MKVFISWSGAKSLAVAEVLRGELPCLINELEVFVSSEDIEKGSAWFQTIGGELSNSDFGIICLTPENIHSRWLHFEAGALAGKFSQTKIAPLLIGLESDTQVPPPLSQLQLTKFIKSDFLKLLFSLNRSLKKPLPDDVLVRSFERSWDEIEKNVEKKLKDIAGSAAAPIVKRSQEEILEEILDIVRSLRRDESEVLLEKMAHLNSQYPSTFEEALRSSQIHKSFPSTFEEALRNLPVFRGHTAKEQPGEVNRV